MGAIKTKTKFQATRKRSKAALDLQCRDRHKWTNQNGRTGSAIRKPVEGCQPRHCECVCWLRRQSKHRDNEWHTHISSAPLFILEDFLFWDSHRSNRSQSALFSWHPTEPNSCQLIGRLAATRLHMHLANSPFVMQFGRHYIQYTSPAEKGSLLRMLKDLSRANRTL